MRTEQRQEKNRNILTILRNYGRHSKQYAIGRIVNHGPFDKMHQLKLIQDSEHNHQTPQFYMLRVTKLQNLQKFQRENKMAIYLNRTYPDHFPKIYDCWIQDDEQYQIIEHCSYGSLWQLIQQRIYKKKPFPPDQVLYLAKQILTIISLLHHQNIVHRDIKAENIMIDQKFNLKLIGFSNAVNMNQEQQIDAINCNPYYISPETYNNKKWDQKSDIWAAGVLLYYLENLTYPFPPFENQSALSINEAKQQNNQNTPFAKTLFNYLDIQTLLDLLLSKEAQARPLASSVLSLSIFNQLNYSFFEQDVKQRILLENRFYWNQLSQEQTQSTFALKTLHIDLIKPAPTNKNKELLISAIRLKKYGFFLLTNQHSILAYFNDHSTMRYEPEFAHYKQVDPNKFKILQFVHEQYLQKIMKHHPCEQLTTEAISIDKLFWHKNSLFVKLSNHIFHIFLQEQTKQDEESPYFKCQITLNHNHAEPRQILVSTPSENITFNSLSQALNCPKYGQIMNNIALCFKLMRENSRVSLQKYVNYIESSKNRMSIMNNE